MSFVWVDVKDVVGRRSDKVKVEVEVEEGLYLQWIT